VTNIPIQIKAPAPLAMTSMQHVTDFNGVHVEPNDQNTWRYLNKARWYQENRNTSNNLRQFCLWNLKHV